MPLRILVVDDEPTILKILAALLVREGYDVVSLSRGDEARDRILSEDFDLLLSDLEMSPVGGMELLRLIRDVRPTMASIIMTGYASSATIAEAIKLGAYDYAAKPLKLEELFVTVRKAIERKEALTDSGGEDAAGEEQYFDDMVAVSPGMREICETIKKVAPTDTPVLVWGERGTGKQLVARAIHRRSRRGERPLGSVNCRVLPKEDVDSTLFGGHSLFEKIDGGTVLIREIDVVPHDIQDRLADVLTDKEIRGAAAAVPVDVRLLATSAVDFDLLVEDGRLCEKLYLRLNAMPIRIPPLRDRPEDVLPLVRHVLGREVGPDRSAPGIAPDAASILESYPWPGNIEELENVVAALAKALEGDVLKWEELPLNIVSAQGREHKKPVAAGNDEYRAKLAKSFLEGQRRDFL